MDALVRVHHDALARAYVVGRRAWGDLSLSFETFANRAVLLTLRRHAGSPTRVGETLERVVSADLFLAIACDRRNCYAWEVLDRSYRVRLERLAARRGLSPAAAEDLVEDLLGDLCTPATAGATIRIATYDGSGSLAAWLSVMLQRRMVDRARVAAASSEAECALDRASVALPTPVDLAIDQEAASRLDALVQEIWADLTPREILALVLKFRDGVAQKRIASILGLSETRVSRTLTSAMDRMRAGLRNRIGPEARDRSVAGDVAWNSLRDIVGHWLQEQGAPADHVAMERDRDA